MSNPIITDIELAHIAPTAISSQSRESLTTYLTERGLLSHLAPKADALSPKEWGESLACAANQIVFHIAEDSDKSFREVKVEMWDALTAYAFLD